MKTSQVKGLASQETLRALIPKAPAMTLEMSITQWRKCVFIKVLLKGRTVLFYTLEPVLGHRLITHQTFPESLHGCRDITQNSISVIPYSVLILEL